MCFIILYSLELPSSIALAVLTMFPSLDRTRSLPANYDPHPPSTSSSVLGRFVSLTFPLHQVNSSMYLLQILPASLAFSLDGLFFPLPLCPDSQPEAPDQLQPCGEAFRIS